ncbi:hypothetical protein V1477_017887 [Vespula maculifrons]|uniref:Uncharacterized protein n=1 Tax=Vespula maculifrons TaxID=7453 RepID=A0ABD2AZP7_VESMC
MSLWRFGPLKDEEKTIKLYFDGQGNNDSPYIISSFSYCFSIALILLPLSKYLTIAVALLLTIAANATAIAASSKIS